MKLITMILSLVLLVIVNGCQSTKKRNSIKNKESSQVIDCQDAQSSKQTLYAIKGNIKNFSSVANCYHQIGQTGVAKLFYQKSIDENKDLSNSLLGLAQINDLEGLPLKARKDYETLINQVLKYKDNSVDAYLDYALFSLFYRDSTASNVSKRRLKGDSLILIKSYQRAITGDLKKSLSLWKTINFENLNITAYRAYHIAHLAKILKDSEVLKQMKKYFDLTIPEYKRREF